jgi:hypothetical protein
MKPRTLAVVVAAGLAGLAINVAVGWLFISGFDRMSSGLSPLVAHMDFDGGGVLFPNQAPARPCTKEELPTLRGAVVPVRDYTFSGPFAHANLTVVLIHGPDTLKDDRILSLQEALEQNLVVVHEGRLTIENRGNVPVFIQAGDIVKGGCQDRVLPYDQLIPPRTGEIQLAGFCVEAGRSGPRGLELSSSFQSAMEQLPGKRLNLAARYRQSQTDVWAGVAQIQLALARNLGGPVQSPQSMTSMQLTLEAPRVQAAVQAYVNDLAPVVAGQKNVIGMAVVINGQVQGAEVYASSSLFQRLWPKLLKANAVAAVAERQPGQIAAPPASETIQKLLADAETGQAFQQQTASRTRVIRQEGARNLLFDTCDPARENLVLHRSYLAR